MPDNFNNNLGFRLALSHTFPSGRQYRALNGAAVEAKMARSIPAWRVSRRANTQLRRFLGPSLNRRLIE